MTHTPGQRPFDEVERAIFRLYVNCRLSLPHPRQLYQEYALTYEQLALIAGCSIPAMTRWMNQDQAPSRPLKAVYLRRLGEFHFLLEHYRQIPPDLWNLVCPLRLRDRSILYPNSP